MSCDGRIFISNILLHTFRKKEQHSCEAKHNHRSAIKTSDNVIVPALPATFPYVSHVGEISQAAPWRIYNRHVSGVGNCYKLSQPTTSRSYRAVSKSVRFSHDPQGLKLSVFPTGEVIFQTAYPHSVRGFAALAAATPLKLRANNPASYAG